MPPRCSAGTVTTTAGASLYTEPATTRNQTFLQQIEHLRRLADNWRHPRVTQGSTAQAPPLVTPNVGGSVSTRIPFGLRDMTIEQAHDKHMLVLQPTHDARAQEWQKRVLWVTPGSGQSYIEVKLPHQSTHSTQTDQQNDQPIMVPPLQPQIIAMPAPPLFAPGPIVQFQQPSSQSWEYQSMRQPWYDMRHNDRSRHAYRTRKWRGGHRGRYYRGPYTY